MAFTTESVTIRNPAEREISKAGVVAATALPHGAGRPIVT
jgi:hypothetical protein